MKQPLHMRGFQEKVPTVLGDEMQELLTRALSFLTQETHCPDLFQDDVPQHD